MGWPAVVSAPDQQAASIRWFLGKAFVGATPEHMLRYALETANQPGAHYAPLKFLTFSLFTEQAITRLYSRLKLPCLVLYDQDPNIGFERMSELTDVHSHWAAKQLVAEPGSTPLGAAGRDDRSAGRFLDAAGAEVPCAQEISRSTAARRESA